MKTLTSPHASRFLPLDPLGILRDPSLPVHNVAQLLQEDEIIPQDPRLPFTFRLRSLRVERDMRPALRWIHVDSWPGGLDLRSCDNDKVRLEA